MLRESGMEKIRSRDIKKAFDEYDADKSGTISQDEMKHFIKVMSGIWENILIGIYNDQFGNILLIWNDWLFSSSYGLYNKSSSSFFISLNIYWVSWFDEILFDYKS